MTYCVSILSPGPDHRHVLVWQFEEPLRALSSAPVGGGFSRPDWLLNIGVSHDYSRIDLDEHAATIADRRGLSGPGIAMFTAVDVTRAEHACFEGASVSATVGVTKPTWAADPEAGHALWPRSQPRSVASSAVHCSTANATRTGHDSVTAHALRQPTSLGRVS